MDKKENVYFGNYYDGLMSGRIELRTLEELHEQKIKSIQSYIYRLKNPLTLENYRFFSEVFNELIQIHQSIIQYYKDKNFKEKDSDLIYKYDLIIALLNILNTVYKKYLSDEIKSKKFKISIDVKPILDQLLSVIEQVL